jgi:hypothetical protein
MINTSSRSKVLHGRHRSDGEFAQQLPLFHVLQRE